MFGSKRKKLIWHYFFTVLLFSRLTKDFLKLTHVCVVLSTNTH